MRYNEAIKELELFEDRYKDHLSRKSIFKLKDVKYQLNREGIKMTLEERIIESVNELDEEIRGGLWDAWEQSDGSIWLVESGMAYNGDDKEAKEVAQVENGKVINWR